jgi:sugar lactone lactonase YvrE
MTRFARQVWAICTRSWYRCRSAWFNPREAGHSRSLPRQAAFPSALIVATLVFANLVPVTASATSGDVSTFAFPFNSPQGLAIDGAGNIFMAEAQSNLIRKITPNGVVTTFAGSGAAALVDGVGTAASFNRPQGVATDSNGNVYVADGSNNAIRKITPDGTVTTLAGSGSPGSDDGIGPVATFGFPRGLAVDAAGRLYVADTGTNKIRLVTPSGLVTTVAGSTFNGFRDDVGTLARFDHPSAITIDRSGMIYIADTSNNRIRKMTPGGVVTTFAGNGTGTFANGPAASASFFNPIGIEFDRAGSMYIADQSNNLIRKITPAGDVTTLAGRGFNANIDGPAAQAAFSLPTGITVDSVGNVYVTSANAVRRIESSIVLPSTAIVTAVHNASHQDITGRTVPTGAPVHALAVVTGNGPIPTGTLQFAVYFAGDCVGDFRSGGSPTLDAAGQAESAVVNDAVDLPQTPGTYSWQVHYSGDSIYPPTDGPCAAYSVDPTTSTTSTTTTAQTTTTNATTTTTTTEPSTTTTAAPPTTTTTLPTTTTTLPNTTTTAPPTTTNLPTTTTTLPNTTTTAPPTTTNLPTTTTTAPPTTTTTSPTSTEAIRLNPARGPQVGGTAVEIVGNNLEIADRVEVGGLSVPFVVIRSGRVPTITFTTPSHAPTSAEVRVLGPGRIWSGTFTYTPVDPPRIVALLPTRVPQVGGSPVVLFGRNLDRTTSVTVDGVTAAFSPPLLDGRGGGALRFVTPPHVPGTAEVVVTTPAGSSLPFTITYTPVDPPRIDSLFPSRVPQVGGTSVQLRGRNLDQTISVTVDGVTTTFTPPILDGKGGGLLRFVTPQHAPGPAEVIVTTPAGSSVPFTITYTPVNPPVIRAFSPIRVSSNGTETVVISGTNLAGATSVTVDGIPVQHTESRTNGDPRFTTIEFIAPQHAAGTAAVIVTTPAGTSEPAQLEYFRERAPRIISLIPSLLFVQGGTVTIDGVALQGATSVTIDGISVVFTQRLNGRSAATLVATAPAHAPGAVTVIVTTPAGDSAPATLRYINRRF